MADVALERAVEVLGRHRHRGTSGWHADGGCAVNGWVMLTRFEAEAVAREYERLESRKAGEEIAKFLDGITFDLTKPLD